MTLFRNLCAALFLVALPVAADPISYVILTGPPGTVLQRVSNNGPTAILASVPNGLAVAKNTAGSYMVVTGGGLSQVTATGTVTPVAVAPTTGVSPSNWVAVASDGLGNVIVGDNGAHAVWLITPSGVSTKIANYTAGSSGGHEDMALAVDLSGNYIVLEDNASALHMFSVTPGGSVTPISLSGATAMSCDTSLIPDGAGNYIFVSWKDNAVFKVTPTGAVSLFAADVGSAGDYPTSVAQNPDSGDLYVTTHNGLILHINSLGTFINEIASFPAARDIIIETYGDLAQLAAGGVWATGFYVLNTGNLPASYWVGFFDPSGNAVELPFFIGNFSTLQGTLPAHGMTYIEAANANAALVVASGIVSADPTITVQALFREHSPNGNYYEAGVPASGGSTEFTIPFDATTFAPTGDSLFTGFAIANLDGHNSSNVNCVATDDTGRVIPNAITISPLPPLGHFANFYFTALTGRRGTLDCSSDTRIAAIALRFIGATAFSTLPVLYK